MLDPLTGKVYEVSMKNNDTGCVFDEIVMADYPMIVVERETMKLN